MSSAISTKEDFKEATNLAKDALDLSTLVFGPENENTRRVGRLYGSTLLDQGRNADARHVRDLSTRAHSYLHEGNYPQAVKLYKEALDSAISRFGEDSCHTAHAAMVLANIYVLLTLPDLAKDLYQKYHEATESSQVEHSEEAPSGAHEFEHAPDDPPELSRLISSILNEAMGSSDPSNPPPEMVLYAGQLIILNGDKESRRSLLAERGIRYRSRKGISKTK